MKLFAMIIGLALTASADAQVQLLSTMPQPGNPLYTHPIGEPLPSIGSQISILGVDQAQHGDDRYHPEVGQQGKDVIWVPTPPALVKAMLTVANVKPTDYVVDLGSGDGRIAIAAARDFGARAMGIEFNRDMAALSRRNAQKAGVGGKATFLNADIFETDFSNASVVTMYLLPSLNLKLKDQLLKMRPGTRIVSHAFNMGDWEPDRIITTDEATGYFWIIPGKADGRWAFEIGNERFAAELMQQYQKLTPGSGTELKNGVMRGNTVVLNRNNGQRLEGELQGNQIVGNGWIATRIRGGS